MSTSSTFAKKISLFSFLFYFVLAFLLLNRLLSYISSQKVSFCTASYTPILNLSGSLQIKKAKVLLIGEGLPEKVLLEAIPVILESFVTFPFSRFIYWSACHVLQSTFPTVKWSNYYRYYLTAPMKVQKGQHNLIII